MNNKLLEISLYNFVKTFYKSLYKILKIIIMFYLFIKNYFILKQRMKYKVVHSCIVSNKGEYIKDITNLVKMYNVYPNTKIDFYKSLIKEKDVVVHVYLDEECKEGENIEIKYILT